MPRLSVVWKFNLWVLGGLVILLGSAIAFGASEMSGLGESRVRLALTGAGTAASLVLEGAAALTPEATEGEAYQKTLAVLKRAVATFGLSDLYVLRPRADDPKTWEFLYDVKDGPFAEGKGKESGFEAYEDPPAELAQAWASADPVVTSEPYTDAYGTYRSSFLAVPDGAGKPAVVVGADFDLAQLADARKGEVVFVIVLALGGAAFLLALSWVSSRIIGRPLKTISGRFQGLARGTADLTLGLKVGGGDELADLAGAFNEFLEKLRFLVADLQMGVHETYRGRYGGPHQGRGPEPRCLGQTGRVLGPGGPDPVGGHRRVGGPPGRIGPLPTADHGPGRGRPGHPRRGRR
jgi:HAMP domain-containing protein